MAINLDKMLAGYIEAIEFTDMAAGDECHGHEFADATSEAFRADCAKFIEASKFYHDALAEYAPDYSDEQMGRDFWLTRNGHGAGFWDRDELDFNTKPEGGKGYMISMGNALTSVAEPFGSVDLYLGDDGLIYG